MAGRGDLHRQKTRVAELGRVAVVGMGDSGASCVRFLAPLGTPLLVMDSRQEPPNYRQLRADWPDLDYRVGGFDRTALCAVDTVLLSPGVDSRSLPIAELEGLAIRVRNDVWLFRQLWTGALLAITGSNGKSTVTSLAGEILKRSGRRVAVGGNIGTPALDLLSADADIAVLELSSFQLEYCGSLAADAAVVLNLCEDHMDRYADFAAYAEAKRRIYQDCRRAIVNRDDGPAQALANGQPCVGFSLGPPGGDDWGLLEHHGTTWLGQASRPLMPVADVPLAGRHNLANVLAACALVAPFGLGAGQLLEGIAGYRGLPHRSRLVRQRRGVDWYDDSKGTNVGATLAALAGLGAMYPGRCVLIAGGLSKGADFLPLRETVAERCRALMLIGEAAAALESLLGDVIPCERCADMNEAVARAADLAVGGDYVLLSPACASFDMYRNYQHRGDHFAELVGELAA